MKKIIKNKVYDTEKARLIGEWSNDCPSDDFNFMRKSLYCKRSGEYFLYMQGGAFTECASSDGHASRGGEKLLPLSVDQARSFAFDSLPEAVALAEFEPAPEDDSRQSVTFVLPTSLVENIRLAARSDGRKICDVVTAALSEYLSK